MWAKQRQQWQGVERERKVFEEGMEWGKGEGKERNGWGSRDFKRVKQRMNVSLRERNPPLLIFL